MTACPTRPQSNMPRPRMRPTMRPFSRIACLWLPAISSLISTIVPGVIAWSFSVPAASGFAADGPVDYLRQVKPIFEKRCSACHGALKQESGLRLDAGSFILKGADSGPVVIPGDAAKSAITARIETTDEAIKMPPKGEGTPLTADEIAILKAWISHGAKYPENEPPPADPRAHWAFQRPVRVPLDIARAAAPSQSTSRGQPGFEQPAAQNPIDLLVAKKHAEFGLTSQPPASKAIQLRRVYLDLLGLPPTRDQLQDFLADNEPDAYERVVTRLLESPRYGERWARHWMDVWRYSDWYGRRMVPDVWNSAPQIWRWRDWIVRSLNEDRGYDWMVKAMLAGDEIAPGDPATEVATGYLVRNWYALNPNDWMRSNVEHTGKAFLGLTFNCAHCHDHKYDPITQNDYFRFRAFFEPIGIRQDRWPGESDPGPFQEYSYSTLRKIVRVGSVRIYDKNPQAPTWFYTMGDERNRLSERGSIPAGLPTFLGGDKATIAPVSLPPQEWHPSLHANIHETVLKDFQAAITTAMAERDAATPAAETMLTTLRENVGKAEAALQAERVALEQSGQSTAVSGKQSLLFDATNGRRILQNGVTRLKSLEEGTTFAFQLQILRDAHFNFQFAKDVVKGLTAGYLAFDNGRIVSYQPGSFTEFEIGRYDFAAGQNRFAVTVVLHPKEDKSLVTIRTGSDNRVLVENAPVALNGWNPVGDPTKAISFDARKGSLVLLDDVQILAPAVATNAEGSAPERMKWVTFDFEPPAYADGRDAAGIDGWVVSQFGEPPATSTVTITGGNPKLQELVGQLRGAKSALESAEKKPQSLQAKVAAAEAKLASYSARYAAESAVHGITAGADPAPLVAEAARLDREASIKTAQADVLLKEVALAVAEAKPASDANRAKEMEVAGKQLADARAALDKANAPIPADAKPAYSPLGPTYANTSTGRRRALAEWIANRDNPLTARVAINHIWTRHFHAPLVSSVFDFGRNGTPPSNQELLDWLSVELMESGWSMKHLHRLIVTSNTYRQASSASLLDKTTNPSAAMDPENRYLWRMNVGRMESEVVRDSLLWLGGRIDLTIGGQELENGEALTTRRRSMYYSCHPELDGKSQFSALFDAPEAAECYRRTKSIIPQQALALTNSDLVHQICESLTQSILRDAPSTPEANSTSSDLDAAFARTSFETILGREPDAKESTGCVAFLARQRQLLTEQKEADPVTRSRESLVRALLNHNDFVTVR